MKAIVYTEYGSPGVLRLTEVDKPVPKENEVLVRVYATTINDWDLWLMNGEQFLIRAQFGLSKPKLRILGTEVAGRVEQAGGGVTGFKPGDDVYGDIAECGFGGFAEYVCVREDCLGHKPPGMTHAQAASLPHAAMLAMQGLIEAGKPKKGQSILINGAGGGVGTLGVQMVSRIGVEMTGVDSADKLDHMRSMGYDHVIDYRQTDFTKTGRHYDFILDTKSTRGAFACARALKPGGTYATVGGIPGVLIRLLLAAPLVRLLTGKRIRIVMLKSNKDLAYVNRLFEDGQLRPVLDGPFTLEQTPEAMARFAEARHKGKVVITVDAPGDTR